MVSKAWKQAYAPPTKWRSLQVGASAEDDSVESVNVMADRLTKNHGF